MENKKDIIVTMVLFYLMSFILLLIAILKVY